MLNQCSENAQEMFWNCSPILEKFSQNVFKFPESTQKCQKFSENIHKMLFTHYSEYTININCSKCYENASKMPWKCW